LGSPTKFSKSHCYDDFFKNGLKSNFRKNFTRDFPVKYEENFLLEILRKIEGDEFFTRDFPGKKMKWKFLEGFL